MIFDKLGLMGIDEDLAIDIGTVLFNDRPVGLLHVSAEKSQILVRYLISLGLHCRITRNLLKIYDPATGQYILHDFDDSSNEINSIHEIWISHCEITDDEAERYVNNTGYYLGYPKCCIASYIKNENFSNIYNMYINSDKSRSWLLNRFSMLFDQSRLALDYMPCSLGCSNSIKLSERILPTVERSLGRYEFQLRKSRNMKTFSIMKNRLIRFEAFKIEGTRACVDVSDIRKQSDYSFEANTRDQQINILAFDYNHDQISGLKEMQIVHNGKSSVFDTVII
jgi:hypothetical protein